MPLPATEGPLGVIVVGRPGGNGFSADDVAFLNILAGLCALAVERIRLLADRSHVREILAAGRSPCMTPRRGFASGGCGSTSSSSRSRSTAAPPT